MGLFSSFERDFADFLRSVATATSNRGLVARNFLLDEGILAERAQSYNAAGAVRTYGGVDDWEVQHKAYLTREIFLVPPDDGPPMKLSRTELDLCSETFRFIDPRSPYWRSDHQLHLIRVEEIGFISRITRTPPDFLRHWAGEVVKQGLSAPERAELDAALRVWAKAIELRPVFSAYWADVEDLFGDKPGEDKAGWANALRNRLGLSHLNPAERGEAIEVLVFRYAISELPYLIEKGDGFRLLAPPTVLDGNFSPAFFPVPFGSATGYTVELSGDCERLPREVLHPPFGFQSQHLWRVGMIDQPFNSEELPTLRGLHLICIRNHSGRADYAADTDEDLL